MNSKYKTFEELKEEFGEDYEHKFYEMALSAVKENERLIEELQRKDNIISELKKHIGEEWYCYDNESIEFNVAKDILDKIKELEGK